MTSPLLLSIGCRPLFGICNQDRTVKTMKIMAEFSSRVGWDGTLHHNSIWWLSFSSLLSLTLSRRHWNIDNLSSPPKNDQFQDGQSNSKYKNKWKKSSRCLCMVDVSRYVWLLSMKFSYYDIPSLVAIPVVGIGIFNTPWIFYLFGIFDHLEYFTHLGYFKHFGYLTHLGYLTTLRLGCRFASP